MAKDKENPDTTQKPKKKRKPVKLNKVNGKKKEIGQRTYTARINYKTFEGHKLTVKEAKFIDLYIETGNQRQSVIDAGYKTRTPGQYGQVLLDKVYIKNEIDYRLKKLEDDKIASAEEILKYFTGVMRGEIKDQFGLDAPLGERTKAAQELAKRKIDIAQRVSGQKQAEVKISLVWDETETDDIPPENGDDEE